MLRVLFLLLIARSAVAQQESFNILKGYLGVTGGESFSYRMEFRDSAGIINGYAYTYMWEKQEIKAAITGIIDRDKKTIAFRETGIIYNHGFQSNTTICLLDALLTYQQQDGSMVLTGPFKSADAGNVYCGKGSLSFTGNLVVASLFKNDLPAFPKPVVGPVAKPARPPVRIIYDTIAKRTERPVVIPTASIVEKITSGTDKTYEWNTELIGFSICDGGRVDGDVVTLLFDDEVIIKGYTLVSEPKEFSFPLHDNKVHTITIKANNEGSELPNTANIELRDGTQKYSIIAYNPISKKAVIRIRKKD